jgi:superfamily II DNA/RNA helicase
VTTASRKSPEPKKKSLLHRLGAKIKKIVGIGGAKKEKDSHGKVTAHAAHAKKPQHSAKDAKSHEPRRHEEKVSHGQERRHAPGGRSAEGREGRKGDRQGRDGRGRPQRGGRDRKPPTEHDEPRHGHVKRAAEPPPPPPPVPPGPYPAAFEALALAPSILAGVRDLGYENPTEIQVKAAPIILAGKDIVGASQTGTGKTAAFGMPLMTRLGAPGALRCLILEPTRELAAQVVESFEKLGAHTGLRTVLVHGGVGYGKQREGIERGCDVIVATPGRLLDFMQDGTVKLDTIEILVLDEVDRMLDMGFLPDVRRIVEKTPRSRQTLFFSATMPPQIKSLADWALKEPESVEIGIRFSPAETVSHYLYPVARDQREELILELLRRTDFHSVMIFTRTKMDADRLFAAIQRDGEHKATVMHSDIGQKDREKALQGFRSGEFEIIVATDVAARGLDVSGVTHVINYMVPENPEDYVHRIGRTGRAQKEGDAFTLFSAEEIPFVQSIERLIGQTIERKKLENFNYKYTTVLDNEDKARAIMFGRKGKKRR